MAKQPQKNGAGKRAKLKKKRRLPPGVPNPVDIHVGARLRIRRSMLGLSQEKLGDAVGLTFQQVQKYERGANRMGASRLFQFCQILGVPITYFFDDMPTGLKTTEQQVVKGLSENITPPSGARSPGPARNPGTGPRLLQNRRPPGSQAPV